MALEDFNLEDFGREDMEKAEETGEETGEAEAFAPDFPISDPFKAEDLDTPVEEAPAPVKANPVPKEAKAPVPAQAPKEKARVQVAEPIKPVPFNRAGKPQVPALEGFDPDNPLKSLIGVGRGGELANIPGVAIGRVGEIKVSRYPVEKIKFTKNKKERIAFLEENAVAIRSHYNDKIGAFFCFDGVCCQMEGFPNVNYWFPIVVYTTDKAGKPISRDLQLMLLKVGDSGYQELVTIRENQNTGLTGVDMVVTCTEETYQKVMFTATSQLHWPKAADAPLIVQKWNTTGEKAIMAFHKQLTEKMYLQRMEAEGAGAGEVSVDEVFGS